MSVNGLSGHGTIVAVQLVPGGAFTDIAELGDISTPGLSRNEFDATTQNEEIDSYILGVLRRGALTFPVNFIPTNNTHDHLTGLIKLHADNVMTGWRQTFPDGTEWIMSGQVQALGSAAPVDGKLSMDVTIRMSGVMTIGGVTFGA